MFRYKKGLPHKVTYPLTEDQMLVNGAYTIHSPTFDTDPRVDKDLLLTRPLMPEDGAEFYLELCEVAKRVEIARANTPINTLDTDLEEQLCPKAISAGAFVGEIFKNRLGVRTYKDGAEAVKADWPTHILKNHAEYLLSDGAKLRKLFHKKFSCTEFTDGPVLLADLLGKAVHTVSPTAFYNKWYFGRPRPQEVAHAWAKGELDAGKFADTVLCDYIDKEAVAKDDTAFPIYSAPLHCSYPAMHGAAAGVTVLFGLMFQDLTETQLFETRRTAGNTALFRDYGGVHYRSDSLNGLDLGERVVAKNIYSVLSDYADAAGYELVMTKEEIDTKAKSLLTNWATEL